jgi:ABC-type uncharacterized transport system substrate-binding protein
VRRLAPSSGTAVGRPYLPHEALVLLSNVSHVPIYAVTPNMLGRGAVGGRLLDFASHGVTAAQLALRILSGERAASSGSAKSRSGISTRATSSRRWW